MTEPRKRYYATLIIFAILLTGALVSLISDSPLLTIIFIVSLIIPSVGIVKYLWDVPSKIALSKDEIVIYYGRSALENLDSGGSFTYYGRSISEDVDATGFFTFPSVAKLKWESIADFDIESYTHETFGGDDAGTITTTYHLLIITGNNIDNLKPNTNQRYTIVVNRFEKTPEEILAICKQFQRERSCSSN